MDKEIKAILEYIKNATLDDFSEDYQEGYKDCVKDVLRVINKYEQHR